MPLVMVHYCGPPARVGSCDHLPHPALNPFGIPSLAGGMPGACAGLPHDVTR